MLSFEITFALVTAVKTSNHSHSHSHASCTKISVLKVVPYITSNNTPDGEPVPCVGVMEWLQVIHSQVSFLSRRGEGTYMLVWGVGIELWKVVDAGNTSMEDCFLDENPLL